MTPQFLLVEGVEPSRLQRKTTIVGQPVGLGTWESVAEILTNSDSMRMYTQSMLLTYTRARDASVSARSPYPLQEGHALGGAPRDEAGLGFRVKGLGFRV